MNYIESLGNFTSINLPNGNSLIEVIGAVSTLKSDKMSIAHITMIPGGIDPYHFHPVVHESYFILKGKGQIKINDKISDVKSLDSISIPPNTKHCLINSSEEPLEFLAICTPAWTPDCETLVL